MWMILSVEQIQSQEQIVLYKKSKEIISEGEFENRKWNSNSPEVCKAIENYEAQLSENLTDSKTNLQKAQNATAGFLEDDSSFVKSELNSFVPEPETVVKILGHSWDTKNDMLKFDLKELVNHARS